MYACDRSWWKHHYDDVKATFSGQLWTQDKAWCDDIPDDLHVLCSVDAKGLSIEPGVIHQGANSGYQAINLAYHLGAQNIILLGYDMSGIGTHWFGEHNGDGLSKATNYGALVSKFATIKPEDYGIAIINCTRRTALECFPRMELNAAIRQASHCSVHRPDTSQAA